MGQAKESTKLVCKVSKLKLEKEWTECLPKIEHLFQTVTLEYLEDTVGDVQLVKHRQKSTILLEEAARRGDIIVYMSDCLHDLTIPVKKNFVLAVQKRIVFL